MAAEYIISIRQIVMHFCNYFAIHHFRTKLDKPRLIFSNNCKHAHVASEHEAVQPGEEKALGRAYSTSST